MAWTPGAVLGLVVDGANFEGVDGGAGEAGGDGVGEGVCRLRHVRPGTPRAVARAVANLELGDEVYVGVAPRYLGGGGVGGGGGDVGWEGGEGLRGGGYFGGDGSAADAVGADAEGVGGGVDEGLDDVLGGVGLAARHGRPGAAPVVAGCLLLVFVAGDGGVVGVVPGEGDELVAGGGGEDGGGGGEGPGGHFARTGAVARRVGRAHLEGVADAVVEAGDFPRGDHAADAGPTAVVAGGFVAVGGVRQRPGGVGPAEGDLPVARRGGGT